MGFRLGGAVDGHFLYLFLQVSRQLPPSEYTIILRSLRNLYASSCTSRQSLAIDYWIVK